MHTLVVAEKPSVARDIARVLGARDRGESCLISGGYVVTWALGHLVTLKEPEELDEKYKRWRAQDLPILPERKPSYADSTPSQPSLEELVNPTTCAASVWYGYTRWEVGSRWIPEMFFSLM